MFVVVYRYHFFLLKCSLQVYRRVSSRCCLSPPPPLQPPDGKPPWTSPLLPTHKLVIFYRSRGARTPKRKLHYKNGLLSVLIKTNFDTLFIVGGRKAAECSFVRSLLFASTEWMIHERKSGRDRYISICFRGDSHAEGIFINDDKIKIDKDIKKCTQTK